MKRKVFIITINFNGLKDTLECLSALSKIKSDELDVKTLVVDNASKVDEISQIKKQFPEVLTIKNKENLGFTGGNNEGLGYALAAGADYILLLNNDTVGEENFLVELVKFLEAKKEAGVVGSTLEFEDNGKTVYDLGGRVSFYGRTDHHKVKEISKATPQQTDYVCGAALMVRKEVVEKVGTLDEDYFFGYEDVDFCRRVRGAGFEVWLNPSSVVMHKVGGTLKEVSPVKIYYNLRNNLLFIRKNFPIFQQLFGYLYAVALSFKILLNNPDNCRAVYQAWGDFMNRRYGKLEQRSRNYQ